MWRAHFVLIPVVVCIIAACHGASMAEESQRNMRLLGSMTRYYVRTVDQEIEIKNDPEEIEAVTVLTNETRVAIVVHGRASSASSEFASRVRTAFLNNDETIAVISVDWEVVSKLSYSLAASAARNVGEDLATFISTLEENGKLDRELLHLVGFDLGAHVAGFASRNARAKKITGLNPAGENWGQYSDRLRATDADLVEVIHTDGVGIRAYGLGQPIGHLDFFPNGGTRQPGCIVSNNLCHHNRAWELFAATLDLPGQLRGLRCDSMAQVTSNRCTGEPAVMGTARLQKLETGIYRLATGRLWPYTV